MTPTSTAFRPIDEHDPRPGILIDFSTPEREAEALAPTRAILSEHGI